MKIFLLHKQDFLWKIKQENDSKLQVLKQQSHIGCEFLYLMFQHKFVDHIHNMVVSGREAMIKEYWNHLRVFKIQIFLKKFIKRRGNDPEERVRSNMKQEITFYHHSRSLHFDNKAKLKLYDFLKAKAVQNEI